VATGSHPLSTVARIRSLDTEIRSRGLDTEHVFGALLNVLRISTVRRYSTSFSTLTAVIIFNFTVVREVLKMSKRVFFVTGTSSGFGQNLVQEILDNGDKVVATARDPTRLTFANATPANYLPLQLDVTDLASINSAFDKAVSTFGRIDVVVNNAGFGLCGPFEELEDSQIRQQMEVNFFGLIDVTRKAMQVLRQQKPSGGLIQQISSMAGQKGMPTFSIYCASKWAVEGFTEAIAQEVKPEWGIKFTCIEPGGFR
jgi:NAD(P)-dependent dehydrogenase (short-subunit alcohol dehydrogenase family)